jgi:hypothetical protein
VSYLKILRDSGDDTRRTSARDSLERALDLDTLMRLRDIASERWKDSDRMKKEEEEEVEKEEEKEEEEEEGWGAYLTSWVVSPPATTVSSKATTKTNSTSFSTHRRSASYEIILTSFTFNLLNTFEISISASLNVRVCRGVRAHVSVCSRISITCRSMA